MNIKFTQYVCVIACILIPMCTSSTFAQENNSPSMYTKAQLKFMMRNGFDTEHYDWKNSKVNALLDGAMLSKSGSGGLIGLGVTTFVLSTGLSVASIGALAGNQSQTAHSDEQKIQQVFYFGVGTLIVATTWGIIKRSIARKKVKRASNLNRPYLINPQGHDFNDYFQKEGR